MIDWLIYWLIDLYLSLLLKLGFGIVVFRGDFNKMVMMIFFEWYFKSYLCYNGEISFL